MALPKAINPQPEITATVEIRFTSDIEKSKILELVYPKFATILPGISNRKKNILSNVAFSGDFTLSNGVINMSAGNVVVSFENVADYPLWEVFFSKITECLSLFLELKIIKNINRIGVRFGNLYENVLGLNELLNSMPSLNMEGFDNEQMVINHTALHKNEHIFYIQLINNANLSRNDKVKNGAVIDIDASYSKEDIKPDLSMLINTIDILHNEIKEILFHKLLKK